MLDFFVDLWAAVHFRRLILWVLAIIVVETLIIIGLVHMLLHPSQGPLGKVHHDVIREHSQLVAPSPATAASAATIGSAR